MRRRDLMIGLGAAASVGTGVIGTGAISQVTADRDVQLTIVQDSNAYLALEPTTTTQIVTDDSFEGDLKIDLTAFNDIAVGEGFNQRSTTELTDPASVGTAASPALFRLSNQTDRDVEVTAVTVGDPADLEAAKPIEADEEIQGASDDELRVEFFDVTDPDRLAIDYDNPRTLGPKPGDFGIGIGVRVIVPEPRELGDETMVVLFQATEV